MLPKSKYAWLAAFLFVLFPLASPAAATSSHAEEVSFRNGQLTLHGTVLSPAPAGARLPGVVLVAGAGARGRDAYRAEAEAFVRAGIVVLIYDKRPSYSRATSSFPDLADDAVAGVDLLRSRPDVQPARVGVWGHSEGGWVAPLAATRSPHVAFVIPVAASALPTGTTQLWSNRTHLTHAGVSPSLQAPIGTNLSRMLIAAGLFGDTANDPVAVLRAVRRPVLALFAENDRSTAPGESLRLFRQALDEGGNTHYTLKVIPGANHNLRASADGFDVGTAFAPGYLEAVTAWINASPAGASADRPPAQALASEPVRSLAWYEAPWLHLTLMALTLAAFLACLFRVPAPARWMAILGLLTVLGTAAYVFSVVATGAITLGPVVLGRPAVWLVLQLLAVGVLVSGVVLAARSLTVRLRLLLAAGLLFLPWAAYWGLFTP